MLTITPDIAQREVDRELQLYGMHLITPGVTLGPIEGKLEFTYTGQLERAWFAMNEQKVTATLLPQLLHGGAQPDPIGNFALRMQARDWSTPQFPLDELQLVGVLSEQDFIAQKVVVVLSGICMAGFGKAEFTDGLRVRGILTRMDARWMRLVITSGN